MKYMMNKGVVKKFFDTFQVNTKHSTQDQEGDFRNRNRPNKIPERWPTHWKEKAANSSVLCYAVQPDQVLFLLNVRKCESEVISGWHTLVLGVLRFVRKGPDQANNSSILTSSYVYTLYCNSKDPAKRRKWFFSSFPQKVRVEEWMVLGEEGRSRH